MNCPICNKTIETYYFCSHDIPPYTVWYDNNLSIMGGITTEVYKPGYAKLFILNGFVYLDKERIEKLLLLK